MELFNFKPQYQPVASNNSPPPGVLSSLRQYPLSNYIVLLAIAAVSAGIGALIGRSPLGCGSCVQYSNRKYTSSDPTLHLLRLAHVAEAHPSLAAEISLGTIKEIFTYNRTFGEDPRIDNGTLAAWDSLVPIGQGTVRFPAGSKKIYTLSVVHQLHCLWSIHQSYYGALQSRRRGDEQQHNHIGPHMRHCFDYLRQGLMCAADSTLEPVDTRLGGVTGWGNERVCRDYTALKDWAEQRRASNSKGFSD
ncbi:uncharacterized protein TERG_03253 [Trichophyton rubrum CBS 118892]|uniref:Tat pathway signal sequence n=1 Tax=Trichophyton rubrum (strain ATCC MYA-4607 / CBS 118892) TaxID=559305 RepID=F2SJP5_TRIRC|nr:uncharacterized protein TERG_03253 [Trichophyton rubrum CBS 118892]EGD86998.2 hypothetical protein TERG_03253 [Trichophyton rubrum CBS 118892]